MSWDSRNIETVGVFLRRQIWVCRLELHPEEYHLVTPYINHPQPVPCPTASRQLHLGCKFSLGAQSTSSSSGPWGPCLLWTAAPSAAVEDVRVVQLLPGHTPIPGLIWLSQMLRASRTPRTPMTQVGCSGPLMHNTSSPRCSKVCHE